MKNIIIGLLVCLIPNLCFGVSARYTQLVREKQQKMEQLEKCMGAAKGLQIAGVSTIGLTAVGVAGNIYEAKKIKDNEKTIENKKSEINKLNAEIAEKTKKQEKESAKKATQNELQAAQPDQEQVVENNEEPIDDTDVTADNDNTSDVDESTNTDTQVENCEGALDSNWKYAVAEENCKCSKDDEVVEQVSMAEEGFIGDYCIACKDFCRLTKSKQ